MGYVYTHRRLDTNEIFYIGIGGFNLSEKEGSYKRAFCKKRTIFWKNITSKTDYTVEITLDNLSLEEASNKEIEYIKLYGRRDLGLGALVNLTDGGEGSIGRIPWNKGQKTGNLSDKTKKKISESNKGPKKLEINLKI